MPAFLFCSLDSPGFLYPAIGLAQELRARGNKVAFATDIKCAQLLGDVGLRRISRGPKDGSSFQLGHWFKPLSVAIQVKHIEYALNLFRADVLLGQSLTLGPLIVAERREIPVGLLGFSTYLWPIHDIPRSQEQPSSAQELLAWRHADMLKWLNQARQLHRLPSYQAGYRETPLLGDLYMVRNVPELLTNFCDFPERVHLVGSCLWEPEFQDPSFESWIYKATKPEATLIYVQQGRQFHLPGFWPKLVEALKDRDYFVAASSDRMDKDIGALPKNFYVRPHLPQGRILQRTHAVVASANTTVTLGALSAGVPSLLIPGAGEQPDVARLAEQAGVARVLQPGEATPEAISQALRGLLSDPQYKRRATACQAAFSKLNGFETAADLLEDLARTRKP